ncbi:cytochrome P450 18a1 [Dermacentor silvarum]|uniref:cytochrome P450 18a1 n=1 Tax=Dermacentor silvarum TaxID=543639 RepID=UPI002100A3BD|nr:cytochrome P450 18a1 [Dermacentor silvarum]
MSARGILVFLLSSLVSLLGPGVASQLPLPPGPWGLPLVGFLPFLGKEFHRTLQSLAVTYGPIYQIFLGSKRVVVISDPKLVRQAFSKAAFSGRPDTELTKLLQGYGIINSAGALWREQRAFLHRVFRDFVPRHGRPGSVALEQKMQVRCTAAIYALVKSHAPRKSPVGCNKCLSVSMRRAFATVSDPVQTNCAQVHIGEFLSSLGPFEGNSLHVRRSLARAVSNILGSFLMSVTYSSRDSKFDQLLALFEEGFRLLTLAVPVNFIPALRYVPGSNWAYRRIKRNRHQTADYFRRIADAHRSSYVEGTVRDIVDAYLVQLRRDKARGIQREDTYFSEEQLVQVLMDIFSAGLETVTSTLEWAILLLVRHPHVQRRLQEELDAHLASEGERPASMADLPALPYAQATILEVLRRANVIALGNAHATTCDVELAGYRIPADTHVVSNLWAIHMDPDLWEDPEEFRPERFLVNGQVQKPDYFMPFSVGRRMCLGNHLTQSEVFLFLSNLLLRYTLELPEGEQPPSMDGHVAVSHTPRPFRVKITPRNNAAQTATAFANVEQLCSDLG